MSKPDAWKVQSGRYYHYCDTKHDAETAGRDVSPPATITPLFAIDEETREALKHAIEEMTTRTARPHCSAHQSVAQAEYDARQESELRKHIAALSRLAGE